MTYRARAAARALELEANEPKANHPVTGIGVMVVSALAIPAGLMWGPEDWRTLIVGMGVFFIACGAVAAWLVAGCIRSRSPS